MPDRTVALPASDQGAVLASARPEDRLLPRLRILVVDDDSKDLLAVSASLSGLGQEVVAANSGAQALKILLDQEFDLVLTDIFMPDLDGFELARLLRARERSRSTRVVFLTAADRRSDMVMRAQQVGALDVLFKPIDPDALLAKVGLFLDLAASEELIGQQASRLSVQASLLNLAADCVVVRTLGGTILFWNQGAEEILGWRAVDMVGRDWSNALKVGFPCPPEEIRAEIETSGHWQGELRYVGQDGSEIAVFSRWALRRDTADDPELILEISRDVTERNRMVRALEERTRQLEAANARLLEVDRYKDDFLSVISHELRTPLNFIFGYTSILEEGAAGPLSAEQARLLHMISEGADRMLALVNDLLDFAGIQAGKLKVEIAELSLGPLLQAAVEAIGPLADKVGVSLKLDVTDVLVAADDGRVMQILANLLSNAVKFTPTGGSITLSAEPRDGKVLIWVSDTGIGISAEDRAKLFNRFQQLDMSSMRSVRGIGLGLAICKALAEAQGGEIGVESEPGKGSSFWFTLPAVPERADRSSQSSA